MEEVLLRVFRYTIGWIQVLDYTVIWSAERAVAGYNGLWQTALRSENAPLVGQGVGILALGLAVFVLAQRAIRLLQHLFVGRPYPRRVAEGELMPSVLLVVLRFSLDTALTLIGLRFGIKALTLLVTSMFSLL